jgi:hypothetical protein
LPWDSPADKVSLNKSGSVLVLLSRDTP